MLSSSSFRFFTNQGAKEDSNSSLLLSAGSAQSTVRRISFSSFLVRLVHVHGVKGLALEKVRGIIRHIHSCLAVSLHGRKLSLLALCMQRRTDRRVSSARHVFFFSPPVQRQLDLQNSLPTSVRFCILLDISQEPIPV